MIKNIKSRIKQYFIYNNTIPELKQSLYRLKEKGFKPDVIFDIGAYRGEFGKTVLDFWFNSEIYCFEPQSEAVQELKSWSSNMKNVHIIETLLGESDIENAILFKAETASSVLEEHEDQQFPKIECNMRSLFSLIQENTVPVPSLLKIDTQGYEYQILKGLGNYLDGVEVILAELNLIDIHKNVVLFPDVVSFLNEHGFVPFDITELHRRPLDQALFQVDMLFVKADSKYRNDKRWKS